VRPSLSSQLITFELPVSRKSTRAVQGAPDERHGATRDGRVRASQCGRDLCLHGLPDAALQERHEVQQRLRLAGLL
jgi:hypothetical protein